MNYDYLDKKNKYKAYPLKIYLSKENAVVVMFTKAMYSNNFEVLNNTCVISKTYFYKIIEELKSCKTATISDGDISITMDLFEKYCEVTAENNGVVEKVKEVDLKFQEWLLSIDLRKTKRVKALIPISVESEFSFEYGVILDLSETGFKIALNDKLHTLDDVSLSIFDEQHPIGNIVCVVKHESVKENKYIYGLEIKNIDFKAQWNLEEIIKRENKKNK